jgi:hypothetical protein
MFAYVFKDDPGRSIWGGEYVQAGNVICPSCKHGFAVYRHQLDPERDVIDAKLRFATEAVRRQCPDHVDSFRIP